MFDEIAGEKKGCIKRIYCYESFFIHTSYSPNYSEALFGYFYGVMVYKMVIGECSKNRKM